MRCFGLYGPLFAKQKKKLDFELEIPSLGSNTFQYVLSSETEHGMMDIPAVLQIPCRPVTRVQPAASLHPQPPSVR